MRFDGKLPKGFVLSKPVKQDHYEESAIEKLEAHGRLIMTRKRDGWKLFAATDKNCDVRLYTDGMNEVDGRLEHIRKAVRRVSLPPCSLIVGELVAERDGQDDLGLVQSVMQGSLAKALDVQKRHGPLRYMVFQALYMGGKALTLPFADNVLYCHDARLFYYGEPIIPLQSLRCTFAEAKERVRREGWEGLVLYDADFVPEIRTDGKSPKRTRGCYKWKPISEDDFLVREKVFRPGGKELKELVLLQIDPQTGEEFECGKLGSFTAAERAKLAAAAVPLVVQAEFESRYPKSGKIRSARYVRLRTDKKPEDCVAPQSFAAKP